MFRRNNITIRGFLRLYPERFKTRNGYVTVKDAVSIPASTPAPESFAEQIARSDARNAMLKEARISARKDWFNSLSAVYRGV